MTAQAGPAQEHDSAEPTSREDGRVGGPAGGPGAAASCPLLPHPLRRRLVRGVPAEPAVVSWPPSPRSRACPRRGHLYAAPAGEWRCRWAHPARYRLSFSPRLAQTVHVLAQCAWPRVDRQRASTPPLTAGHLNRSLRRRSKSTPLECILPCVWAGYYKQIRKSEQRPPLHTASSDCRPRPTVPDPVVPRALTHLFPTQGRLRSWA